MCKEEYQVQMYIVIDLGLYLYLFRYFYSLNLLYTDGQLRIYVGDNGLVVLLDLQVNIHHRYPSHKYHLFCSTGSIDDGCRSKENRVVGGTYIK